MCLLSVTLVDQRVLAYVFHLRCILITRVAFNLFGEFFFQAYRLKIFVRQKGWLIAALPSGRLSLKLFTDRRTVVPVRPSDKCSYHWPWSWSGTNSAIMRGDTRDERARFARGDENYKLSSTRKSRSSLARFEPISVQRSWKFNGHGVIIRAGLRRIRGTTLSQIYGCIYVPLIRIFPFSYPH